MYQLTRTCEADGVHWASRGEAPPPLPIGSWAANKVEGLRDFPLWQAINSAWSEGRLEERAAGYYVLPYEAYYAMPAEFRADLGLPQPTPTRLRLRSVGSAADPGFRISVEGWTSDGTQIPVHVAQTGPTSHGPNGTTVFLEEAAWRTFREAHLSPDPQASVADRLEYLARVKTEALRTKAELDGYLSSEELTVADTADVAITVDSPTRIDLQPVITAGGQTVPVKVSANGHTQRVVNLGGGKRVVLRENARNGAAGLSQHHRLEGPDVPRFLTNPEAFIPEEIDLSQYSDRVTGIAIHAYNSRPYLHVRKNPGGWLEGALEVALEDTRAPEGGTSGKPFAGPSLSPAAYEELRKNAASDGWALNGDTWVKVGQDDATAVDAMGAAGLDVTRSGYQKLDGVLQIFKNLELLEYVVAEESLRKELTGGWAPESYPAPDDFTGTLLAHQLYGFQWLATLHKSRWGALLADEMGLGKTVQVIAHLARLHGTGQLKPALIVVPLTLMDNWLLEIRRFFSGQIKIHRQEGPVRQRMVGLQAEPDLVITSYDTLRRDQLEMAKIQWTIVICDEAQYVKNPTAQRTSVVKALKSAQRVALTGTPVENGLLELWCIVDYVMPGRLGDWSSFRDDFERPILAAKDGELDGLVSQLQERLQPHYLRREKAEILKELPAKHAPRVLEADLSKEQLADYRDLVSAAKAGGKGAVLGALQGLLQVCARPPLRLLGASLEDRLAACPKLHTTIAILEEVQAKGEKAVIFTRYLELQGLLQRTIQDALSVYPECINGGVPAAFRQRLIELFSERSGFNVLILSHDVGGVGLNITAANHVIHYTRPWNPAKENQATDRVHRIGQEREVHVYIPMTVDERFPTVEVRLAELLTSKDSLARSVLVPKADATIRAEELMDCITGVHLPE